MYNPYNPEANTLDETFRNLKRYLTAQKIAGGSIRSYLSDTRFFFNWLNEFLVSKKIIEGSLSLRGVYPRSNPLQDEIASSSATPRNDRVQRSSALDSASFSVLEITTLLKYVNEAVLNAYKDCLEAGNTPIKTINRRFSALRKFGSFCLAQNWITSNLFDTLRNISSNTPFPEAEYHLEEFKANLWKDGATKSTLKNYLNDSKQFIKWSKNNLKFEI